MRQSELKAILEDHKLWIQSDGKQGKRANLRGADLRGADLSCANLQGAKITTNFKRVGWFNCATFSEDQIPWVVLHPRYHEWAHTLKWVKTESKQVVGSFEQAIIPVPVREP